jgi:hypothetical protein
MFLVFKGDLFKDFNTLSVIYGKPLNIPATNVTIHYPSHLHQASHVPSAEKVVEIVNKIRVFCF